MDSGSAKSMSLLSRTSSSMTIRTGPPLTGSPQNDRSTRTFSAKAGRAERTTARKSHPASALRSASRRPMFTSPKVHPSKDSYRKTAHQSRVRPKKSSAAACASRHRQTTVLHYIPNASAECSLSIFILVVQRISARPDSESEEVNVRTVKRAPGPLTESVEQD